MAIVYLGMAGPNQLPMALKNISANKQQHFRMLVGDETEVEMAESLSGRKENCKQGNVFHPEKGEEFLRALDG